MFHYFSFCSLLALFASAMRPHWPPTRPPPGKLNLFLLYLSSSLKSLKYGVGAYPESPDARACSQFLGRPLGHGECQAAVDNLPRGTLPSIFSTRAHTTTNNYIQVPVRYNNDEIRPSCSVTIDLEGHSLTDQFVFVPWDEIREMAQALVDSCVDMLKCGGFITYGISRTLESLIQPMAYGRGNANIPTPAWVRQPDESIAYVAIPSRSAGNEYSRFGYTLNTQTALTTVPSLSID